MVEIPGVAGATGPAGAAGSSGGNAFATFASAALTLPSAKNGTSSVLLSDIRWVQVGQIVFASDGTYAGTFKVNSATYTNQSSGVGGTAVLQWLQATGDASANQQFGAGTLVPAGYPGAAGTNGTNGFTVAGANNNNTGTQALTATPAQALSVGLTLAASAGKTYLIQAQIRIDLAAATIGTAGPVVTLQIQRTNNTSGAIAGASATFQLPLCTTLTNTACNLVTVLFPYTTNGVSDVIQPFVSVNSVANISAGAVNAVAASITAVELT